MQINNFKTKYKVEYQELKDLKAEIERIQNLLERCRERMQKDFETWLQVMLKQTTSSSVAYMGSTTRGSSDGASTLDQSTTSVFNGSSTNNKVSSDLQEFYKARDAIYNNIQRW